MPSVLVVDDDSALRRLVCRFLETEGFVASGAANGAEALAYLRGEAAPDVIILDLRMPVMDGWAFRREQLNDERLARIPVVILAGADSERFYELNAVASFEKPARFAEVAQTLRRICDGAVISDRPRP